MRHHKHSWASACLCLLLLNGCATHESSATLTKESWQIDDHGPVYVYRPADMKKEEKLPLVLAMNCTSGDPESEVSANGWDKEAAAERFIVIAPTYDDYAIYAEVPYMIKVLDETARRYPIDETRVYATGFSNGGALAVALASEHPERIAAISAAGWMVNANNTAHGYQVPFQLLQGTNEFTETAAAGYKTVMADEQEAIKDMFQMNKMDRGTPDYQKTRYFGYLPDRTRITYPSYTDYDWHGKHARKKKHVKWTIYEYDKSGFKAPFAEFILIDGGGHSPHDHHAAIAWAFFAHFQRNGQKVIER